MKKTIYNFLYNKIVPNSKTKKIKLKSITSRQFPYETEVIAEKLNVPWAIDISNDRKTWLN